MPTFLPLDVEADRVERALKLSVSIPGQSTNVLIHRAIDQDCTGL